MTAALAVQQLANLQSDLRQLAGLRMTNHAFSQAARAHAALLAALPARYTAVLLGLLDRLEAGALFTEESCSFSHQALVDALRQWADKAGAALHAAPPGPA